MSRACFDDATHEALLRKKWFVPGAHERADDEMPYADDYEAALAKDADEKRGPLEMLVYAGIATAMVAGCLIAVNFIVGWLA